MPGKIQGGTDTEIDTECTKYFDLIYHTDANGKKRIQDKIVKVMKMNEVFWET